MSDICCECSIEFATEDSDYCETCLARHTGYMCNACGCSVYDGEFPEDDPMNEYCIPCFNNLETINRVEDIILNYKSNENIHIVKSMFNKLLKEKYVEIDSLKQKLLSVNNDDSFTV